MIRLLVISAYIFVLNDYLFHLVRINRALLRIYNFPTRLHQNRIRQCALPFGINGFYEFIFILNIKDVILISSKEKINVDLLTQKLIQIIESDKVNNDVIITNLRHFEALKLTAEALENVLSSMDNQRSGELLAFDIRKAVFHLGEIVGDITTDDLLENIFSKFCIGK